MKLRGMVKLSKKKGQALGQAKERGEAATMNCSEFQKVLPFIIESRSNLDEHEHLKECAICSDLVRDLQYIADQAKMLLPMRDPSPKVWDNIHQSLEVEGLINSGKAGKIKAVKDNGVPILKKK